MKLILTFGFSFLIPFYLLAQIDISLHLEKGKTYFLSTINKSTIIEDTAENESRTINTEKGGFSYTMLEDLDSLYLMEVTFTLLSLKVETEKKTEFHSSDINDTTDVFSTILRNCVNKPFRAYMQKDYTWKDIQGLDSIFLHSYDNYNLRDNVRRQVDSIMINGVKDFLRNDATITSMYHHGKITSDEIWTSQDLMEHVIPTNDSCTYYLAETNGDFIVIKGSGTVSSLDDATINEGSSARYYLKGTTDATIKFFKNSYWINDATVKTEISGNAEITDLISLEKKLVRTRIISEGTISGYSAIAGVR